MESELRTKESSRFHVLRSIAMRSEPKDQRHFFEKSDEKAAKRHIPNLYGGSLTLNISTCVFLNVLKGGLKLKGLV